MTEAWGMIIAALVALAGTFGGLIIGRRQVHDQAHIEHEQWLRERRQTAYGNYLAAWDKAFGELTTEVARLEEIWNAMEEHGQDPHSYGIEEWEIAHEKAEDAISPVRESQEQVLLLGPEAIDGAAIGMGERLEELRHAFVRQTAASLNPDPGPSWDEAVAAMKAARAEMFEAMRVEVREAPVIASKRRLFRGRRRALSG
ncbi:hypothetical protein ACWGUL_01255 [Streptomyces albidoflavus]